METLRIALPLTVAVFGDKEVGKTSLIRRFVQEEFEKKYKPTVEDIYEMDITRGTHRCRHLKILDTTGSYDFPAMRRIAISKAEAFMLVYSFDDPQSFEKIKLHRDEILKYKEQKKVPMLVVCNKTDRTDPSTLNELVQNCTNLEGSVFSEELRAQKELVDEWQCKLMFTSVKTRWNINRVFYELVDIEEDMNYAASALAIGGRRRRSSVWFQIVCPTSRNNKQLIRTRSLSA